MVLGWRRAFCTSIQKDHEQDSPIIRYKSDSNPSPKLSSRLGGFFSNPSTPRLQPEQVSTPNGLRCKTTVAPPRCSSAPQSPKLHCKTKNSPRFFHRSTPSSPRSPSTFSLLKSTKSLSKSRCGICVQSVKTGQGTAIFTAECGHSFHFPCIASHVRKQGSLTCPICNSTWKEMHLLNNDDRNRSETAAKDHYPQNDKRCVLKVYNDDEPLSSPTSGARFNTIPESDETEEENDEFPGFFAAPTLPVEKTKNVEFALLSEAAVVSVGKTTETYAVVLKIKAPTAPTRRAPIDLVTVLNVGRSITSDKMHVMKKAMRLVVSSLSAADRLSIVAYSSTSKRLLPLRRMTISGKRAARRIIDAVITLDGDVSSPTDSLKKAAKVLEDRREVNSAASILLFSDGHRSGTLVSTTRFSNAEIPLHSISLSACINAPPENTVAKCISGLLSFAIQDCKIQLDFTTGSAPGEITAVYSYAGRPAYLGSGSNWCRVGDFYPEEEKELLIELKVPSSFGGAHRLLSVRCCYKDPSTQQSIYNKEKPLMIPRPRAIGSSTRDIQRLRCLFITTRAVAESRRMVERNDVSGAHHMLGTTRALILQSGSGDEFVRWLETELMELSLRRQDHQVMQLRCRNHEKEAEEKAEPLTPTSAWRAAERLAKVAIMKKSLNRVSDLHGFENARF